MPKFTFVCDHNNSIGNGPVITYETEQLFIDDVLSDFQDFLKGCGFVFEGNVQIVEDDFWQSCEEDEVGDNVMSWTANELTKEPNANQG